MTERTQFGLLVYLALLLGAAGCLNDDTLVINQPPVANAGKDQQIDYAGKPVSVHLNGTASKDPDGDVVSYRWLSGDRIPDAGPPGRAGEVDPSDVARPTVMLGAGTHDFTLWVTDNHGAVSAPDSVTIRVGTDPVAECVDKSFKDVPEACRRCSCAVNEMCQTAVAACDKDCWGLISCVGAKCPDTTDTACIASMCVDFLGAATPATAAGSCVSACTDECRAPASDAGM